MTFSDLNRFWVIFDTCTRPAYYLDVHNLLALPSGATMRYDYRERYLSPTAVAASSLPDSAPKFGLLVYAQAENFTRGQRAPATGTILNNMLWVPTRIVEMLNIPPREGENFFYDFKVLGYPIINQLELGKILSPLIAAREIPFEKWVVISREVQSFKRIQRGTAKQNWPAIVSTLGQVPYQFAGDAFWRLEGPKRRDGGSRVKLYFEKETSNANNGVEIRQVRTVYRLLEGESYSSEIISQLSPQPRTGQETSRFSVAVSAANKEILDITGAGIFDLRQYTAHTITFTSKMSKEMINRSTTIKFETTPKDPTWPTGPDFELRVEARKSKVKFVFGLICGILSLTCIGYGGIQWEISPLTAVTFIVAGICFMVISSLLVRKQLTFKS